LIKFNNGEKMEMIKERIVEIVQSQPEDSSYDEILRELIFERMIERVTQLFSPMIWGGKWAPFSIKSLIDRLVIRWKQLNMEGITSPEKDLPELKENLWSMRNHFDKKRDL
jgi:hypothetical protein